MSEKTYLGDAVYVQRDEFGDVILTTENGMDETQRIYMDARVTAAFLRWIKLPERSEPAAK